MFYQSNMCIYIYIILYCIILPRPCLQVVWDILYLIQNPMMQYNMVGIIVNYIIIVLVTRYCGRQVISVGVWSVGSIMVGHIIHYNYCINIDLIKSLNGPVTKYNIKIWHQKGFCFRINRRSLLFLLCVGPIQFDLPSYKCSLKIYVVTIVGFYEHPVAIFVNLLIFARKFPNQLSILHSSIVGH